MGMNVGVSVLVCSFNPEIKKTLLTLKSLLLQKKIKIQIVIADDGSKDPKVNEITDYFESEGFSDYMIVCNKNNSGTVKNIISGLKQCKYKWVKLLSPGDAIHGYYTLYNWAQFAEQHSAAMVMSNALYYLPGQYIEYIKHKAFPQFPKTLNTSGILRKRNFLLYGDKFLGAATLCNTILLLKYLTLLCDNVIYNEDTVYRLMIANNERTAYFDNDSILYEYSTGISTSGNSIWQDRLEKDINAADKVIYDSSKLSKSFKQQLLILMRFRNNPCKNTKIRYYMTVRGAALYRFINKYIYSRYTRTKCDLDYMADLLNEIAN